MKKSSTFILYLSSFVLLSLLWGCKPAIPKGILKPSKMESLLYDYHYAENLPYKGVQPEVARELYTQSVLKKHKVSPQQFQTSLAYYSRHADKLLEIYKHLDERYTEQSLALGGNVAAQSRKTYSNSSDTVDIWQESPALLLFPYKTRQSIFFDIPIDTAHHAGDNYQLEFNTRYIYPDGQKSSVVLLCLVLKNDSTIIAQTQPSSSGHFQLRVSDTKALGVKRLCGYMLLNPTPIQSSQSLFRALLFENIQLLRMHNAPTSPAGPAAQSSETDTVPQSPQRLNDQTPKRPIPQTPNPLNNQTPKQPNGQTLATRLSGARTKPLNDQTTKHSATSRPKLPPRRLQSPAERRKRVDSLARKAAELPPLPPKNNWKLTPQK